MLNPEEWMNLLNLTWEELILIRDEYMQIHPPTAHLLIGSNEWIMHERARAEKERRTFVATKALRREYARLDQADVSRVNSNADTVYGKELSASLINYLELVIALRYLPEMARHYWVLYACEGNDYEVIAEAMSVTVEAAQSGVSRAASLLVGRIFEPLPIYLHGGQGG